MKVYIKGISYYLPSAVLSNQELIKEFPEWTVDKVASKVGINERHIAASEETSTDMGLKAAQSLINEYNIEKESIDFVILCTQSPDYFLPASACYIQEKLGLKTDSGAFDFNQGCSGYIYGLSIAKGLIQSGTAKNIIFITSETYSKYIHPLDKGNRTIFGDAAAATLISQDGFAEIMDFSLGTDGKGLENLIVKSGAFRHREKLNDLIIDENGNPTGSDFLYMNGSEIFNFTLDSVPPLINRTLHKNGVNLEDIDLFIFHQANKFMLEFLRKKIRIEPEKFYYYLEKVGNTVSSTIPIALKEAIREGRIALASKVLLAGFGVGYSWGGTLLQF